MRQFILEKQEIKNGLIEIDGKDFRYLRSVLRVKIGDMLNVRMKDGYLQNATVAKINENSKTIILQLCANNQKTSITRGVQADEIDGNVLDREYWLFQFLPKIQKFELIVRQAVECGVKVVIPVIGEYTEKSSISALSGAKLQRLERIIKEARQQSGSSVDSKVLEPVSLQRAVELWNESCRCEKSLSVVLSERDHCSENLHKALDDADDFMKLKKICIAVGSEGGISGDEIKYLREKGMFHAVHFAVNILRCETAALYGIAAVQSAIS